MTEFWNSLLTEKSWKLLQDIRKKYDFILIGGWAVYLLTKQQKSKDIDIVVSIEELQKLKSENLQKLKSENLQKNPNLKKYEIKTEEIDIDIYVEYYSELELPVESIKKYTLSFEGFKIPCQEAMVILKQGAYKNRKDSIKGQKDEIDIVSLVFFSDFNSKNYMAILKENKKEFFYSELIHMIKNFKDYNRLNLNPRAFKIRKNKILENLKKV
jgi:hypothetical protein